MPAYCCGRRWILATSTRRNGSSIPFLISASGVDGMRQSRDVDNSKFGTREAVAWDIGWEATRKSSFSRHDALKIAAAPALEPGLSCGLDSRERPQAVDLG